MLAETAASASRWKAERLFEAVSRLAGKLGDDVRKWWNTAWVLHVEGFHEARLDSEDVKRNGRYVEAIVRAAEKVLAPSQRAGEADGN